VLARARRLGWLEGEPSGTGAPLERAEFEALALAAREQGLESSPVLADWLAWGLK
jgi:hypothetical protein